MVRFVKRSLASAAALIMCLVTPVAAQDLRIGLAAEPSAMDPHFHNLTPNNGLLGSVFERLVEFDEGRAGPRPRRILEDGQRQHLGIQAAAGRQVP
jgi:ABC-type transport system substrate-binding protein